MRLLLPLLLLASVAVASEYPNRGPDIYDTKADGLALIDAALVRAKAENKHVLLDFGANWCPWCHLLHGLFKTDATIAATLDRDYVVVMIDVNKRKGAPRNLEANKQYGNPIKEGLPVLVVLDADGKPLVTQETGALEKGDQHDPDKVQAFLARWAPAAHAK